MYSPSPTVDVLYLVVSVVIDPSVSRQNIAPALKPHSTATAGTAFFNGSDHSFVDFEYCCTTSPLGPAIARNCAL